MYSCECMWECACKNQLTSIDDLNSHTCNNSIVMLQANPNNKTVLNLFVCECIVFSVTQLQLELDILGHCLVDKELELKECNGGALLLLLLK